MSNGVQRQSIEARSGDKVIVAANGDRWRVSRRWTNRRGRLDRRWRFRKPRGDDLSAFDFLDPISGAMDGLSGIALVLVATIGFLVAFLLVAFVLLPLLGVMLELAILISLVSSGVLGRVFLRRPWIIEADNLDDPEKSRRFAAKGWLCSRRVIGDLKTGLVTGGLPATVEGAKPVVGPGE